MIGHVGGIGRLGFRGIAQGHMEWNFLGGSLPPGVTFTRASQATYFDSAGLLKTAANDETRFDHDPATLEPRGLLFENQRTNVILQSEDAGTTWGQSALTLTTDDEMAPDGNTAADKLDDQAAVSTSNLNQSVSIADDSLAYVSWVYVNKTTSNSHFFCLEQAFLDGTTKFPKAVLNTNTGVITISPGADDSGVVDVGNYWLLWVVGSNNGTGNLTFSMRCYPAWNTDGGGTFDAAAQGFNHVWGVQTEKASALSSYIKTTTAQVSRSTDLLSADNLDWFNPLEGTFFFEWQTPFSHSSFGFPALIQVDDGTAANLIKPQVQMLDGTFKAGFSVFDTSVSQVSLIHGHIFNDGDIARMACAYRENDFGLSAAGEAPITDSLGTIPAVTEASLMSGSMFSYLRRFIYWPARQSDAFLQAITA